MLKPHLILIGVLAVPAAAPVQAEPQVDIVIQDAATLAWEVTPQGVAFAALDGNRFERPYMAMVNLPAGTISPPHTKSANMFGVMIQGTMTHVRHTAPKHAAQPVGPGGFYKIPANLAHVSSCVSVDPCITFLYQDGAFDFVPVAQ